MLNLSHKLVILNFRKKAKIHKIHALNSVKKPPSLVEGSLLKAPSLAEGVWGWVVIARFDEVKSWQSKMLLRLACNQLGADGYLHSKIHKFKAFCHKFVDFATPTKTSGICLKFNTF